MNKQPLRYQISSWDEVRHIKSNNSPKLKLHTVDLLAPDIHGIVIRVVHEDYGCLFATLVNATGSLLNQNSSAYQLLTTDDILHELSRFGFDIIYSPECNLDGEQLNYLMSIQTLGFDKIRMLSVYSSARVEGEIYKLKLVAFKSTKKTEWMNNQYVCPVSEFKESLEAGYAINLAESEEYKKFDWSFLGDSQIQAIEDILKSNS